MLYTRYTQANFVVAGEKLTTENHSLYWVTDPRPMLHSHFCKVRRGLPKMLEDLDYNGLGIVSQVLWLKDKKGLKYGPMRHREIKF